MAHRPTNIITSQYFAWKLFQRDGIWYADGRVNQPSAGKHSLATRDYKEALASIPELDRSIAVKRGLIKPEFVTGSVQKDLPISRGWELFMKKCDVAQVVGGVTKTTYDRYRAVRDKHIAFALREGLNDWNEVDTDSLRSYCSSLSKRNYADATIYLEGNLIIQIVSWLIDEKKRLPESNRLRLPLRRSHESTAYCPSREVVGAILEICQAEASLNWLGHVVLILCTTGMRIGEVEGLRWNNVDLVGGWINVVDTRHSPKHREMGSVQTSKSGRSRRIPIHGQLRPLLEGLKRDDSHLVFHAAKGGQLSQDKTRAAFARHVLPTLEQRFPTTEGELGVRDLTPHCFRHYFCSECFQNAAVSEATIRDWLGHRSSRIIERYRHQRENVAQEQMAKIEFVGTVERTSKLAAGA